MSEAGPLGEATLTLTQIGRGDPGASARLLPLVYDKLRELADALMRHERTDQTLQPTDLVHEAYLRLIDQTRVDWNGRTHFCAVAAEAMRRILVDHARARRAQKRGGGRQRVALDEANRAVAGRDVDVVDLDEALSRLAELAPREARIVELRFFGGLTNVEVAEVLRVSVRTVEDDWRTARAWLRRGLSATVDA